MPGKYLSNTVDELVVWIRIAILLQLRDGLNDFDVNYSSVITDVDDLSISWPVVKVHTKLCSWFVSIDFDSGIFVQCQQDWIFTCNLKYRLDSMIAMLALKWTDFDGMVVGVAPASVTPVGFNQTWHWISENVFGIDSVLKKPFQRWKKSVLFKASLVAKCQGWQPSVRAVVHDLTDSGLSR